MTFSIYGVSRSGKDYLIQKLKEYFKKQGIQLLHVNGSATLNDMADRVYSKRFKKLTDEEKNILRIDFIKYIHELEESNPYIVVDGHYAFYGNDGNLFKVFTEYDLACYEKFFYLDTNPDFIVERMRASEGEKKNTSMTAREISVWQNFEIDEMTKELIQDDKELHIVKFETDFCLEYIFDAVTTDKYDSKIIAKKMLSEINLSHETVILTDCDKTLSVEDSTNIALDYVGASKVPLKDIFKGDRYSNYQMALAEDYYNSTNAFTDEALAVICDQITVNHPLIDDLKSKKDTDILAITAGNSVAWQRILAANGMNITVLNNNGLISKYVKYFVAKQLRTMGKFVVAIGDSLLDSMMLIKANIAYLATKGYRTNIEAFLKSNPSIRQLSYFEYKYDNVITEDSILSIKTLKNTAESKTLIELCKSDSGITGKKLREAHYKLGSLVSKMIAEDYPNEKLAIVIMMRSGLSFGSGIADELDCPVLFYENENIELLKAQLEESPQLSEYRMVLCDGVVNTGKSINELAYALGGYKPIIATNVISDKFNSSEMIPIYASRISKNSFTGAKQKTISNGKGPDTSDRLFNLM